MTNPLRIQGRMSRGHYLTVVLGSFAALALMMPACFQLLMKGVSFSVLKGIVVFTSTTMSVMNARAAVKRFHDLGRPGKHYWLTWIPVYGTYVGLELFLRKSVSIDGQDSGPAGDKPRGRRASTFEAPATVDGWPEGVDLLYS